MSELDSLRYPVLEKDVLMRQVACMLVIVANALHIFIQADAKMVCLDPVKRTPTFYFSLSLSLSSCRYLFTDPFMESQCIIRWLGYQS